MSEPTWLGEAEAAIDAANGQDPRRVEWGGRSWPLEVLHAHRAVHWLGVLAPQASVAARVAARAHHFRRWTRPRDAYPAGRAGYLRWRHEAKAAHATEVGELLVGVGVDPVVVERVGELVRKDGLGVDPEAQAHEDALCLTFLEIQAAEFLDARPSDEVERIVTKTLAKMSERAVALARAEGLLG